MNDDDLRAVRAELTELLTLQLPDPLPLEEADATDLEGYVRQMITYARDCKAAVPYQYRAGTPASDALERCESYLADPHARLTRTWHGWLAMAELAYTGARETRTQCAVNLAAVERALEIAGGAL